MATRAPAAADRGIREIGCWWFESNGCFAVFDWENREVTPRGRKARALLAYLSSRRGEHVARDRLTELLWGDRGETQARASLRQTLLEIRHATGELISADRDHVWIEVDRIAPSESRSGEAFEDLNHITPEFDDWLTGERQRRGARTWADLSLSAEKLIMRGRGRDAMSLIERMQQIDPYNEDWLRLAMRAEFQSGHPAAIDRRFNEMEALLKCDLGVALASETRALRDGLIKELTKAAEPEPDSSARGLMAAAAHARTALWTRKLLVLGVASVLAAAGTGIIFWPANAEPPRLAVLPFEAAGVEPALAEGISDELMSQLARNDQLRVIGRTSSAQLKGRSADLRSVGRTLGVQYIVEGTVRSSSGQLNVVVSLVRAKDGSAVWARSFKGGTGSLQPIQTAIGSAILQSLDVQPLPLAKSTGNGQAYALYVRAKGLMRDRNFDDLQKAVELLREAVRIDPNFAAGWAQLAAASHLALDKEVVVDLGGPEPVRMSKREAAERAIRLDPTLPEGHAILALVDRTPPRRSRHLRRALELAPGDTQILYWWGKAAGEAGDYKRGGEIMRQAAALDPLWKRPVQEAVTFNLVAGDRTAALQYLRTIKAGNPVGAVEVEVQMAYNEADFSRVVQLELTDSKMPWDAGKARAIRTVASLGFKQEAMLLIGAGPFFRAILRGQAPALSVVLERIRNDTEEGDDLPIYSAVTWELARERRWSDLSAIYDAGFGLMQDVKSSDPGGRYHRQIFAPIYAVALNRVGRERDAARLARTADDGASFTLAKGEVPPEPLVSIAGLECVLGRREDALAHLEQAFAKKWRLDEFVHFRLGDRPEFATLHGDPRFERLRRIQDAHIAKERREIQALGIF
jgi:TolB-like protein/DNA-binding SARP family transcriptional activator/Tfp pilus assembly protein PilF